LLIWSERVLNIVAEKIKKTTNKKTATRKSNGKLSPKDKAHFQAILLDKRREILRNVNEFADEALGRSRGDASGDLSAMPMHMADIGTDNYDQEFALGLMDSERKLMVEIDAALGRLQAGTYGICAGTGDSIGKARLEAKPWARYCMDFTRKLEEGLVEEPEH
jgi:DnaK suppressor protein